MPEFLYALTLTRAGTPGVCMGLFPSMGEARNAIWFERERGQLPFMWWAVVGDHYSECRDNYGMVSATVVACKTAGGPKLFRDAY